MGLLSLVIAWLTRMVCGVVFVYLCLSANGLLILVVLFVLVPRRCLVWVLGCLICLLFGVYSFGCWYCFVLVGLCVGIGDCWYFSFLVCLVA